jgi:glycosyltransferase involved in cell wall biosynthesis
MPPKSKKYNDIFLICVIILLLGILYYIFKDLLDYVFMYLKIKNSKRYLSKSYEPSPVLEEDKNTYTWLIHMYPPMHNAGAEWMAHAMNRYLVDARGYNVNVIVNETKVNEFERVIIMKPENKENNDYYIRHSNALITHLDMETSAIITAQKAKRPLVVVMHNNYRKNFLSQYVNFLNKNIYIIHNSNWIKEYYSSFNIPSIVVYPPVYWKEYATETTREFVTLINLNYNKGGNVFIEIAKRMPDIKFLGVKGGYDGQIMNKNVSNITYLPNTPFIKDMYAKTDILLVPSKEESWGRVAVEAMSSGIPVIANPTPGLVESCGEAGIFCKRSDIDSWVREIRRLKTDSEYYKTKSDLCLMRAKELDPEPQLKAMADWLSGIKWRD